MTEYEKKAFELLEECAEEIKRNISTRGFSFKDKKATGRSHDAIRVEQRGDHLLLLSGGGDSANIKILQDGTPPNSKIANTDEWLAARQEQGYYIKGVNWEKIKNKGDAQWRAGVHLDLADSAVLKTEEKIINIIPTMLKKSILENLKIYNNG